MNTLEYIRIALCSFAPSVHVHVESRFVFVLTLRQQIAALSAMLIVYYLHSLLFCSVLFCPVLFCSFIIQFNSVQLILVEFS